MHEPFFEYLIVGFLLAKCTLVGLHIHACRNMAPDGGTLLLVLNCIIIGSLPLIVEEVVIALVILTFLILLLGLFLSLVLSDLLLSLLSGFLFGFRQKLNVVLHSLLEQHCYRFFVRVVYSRFMFMFERERN